MQTDCIIEWIAIFLNQNKKTRFEREKKNTFGTEFSPPPIFWFVLEVRFLDDEIPDS